MDIGARTTDDEAPVTRRARKKRRTRREIFEGALSLFESRGFDTITVDEICRAADVARGTFFLHFPSKGALLFELDRRLAAELAERLHEPRGSAAGEYRTLVDLLVAHPARARVLGAMLRERLAAGQDAEAPDLWQRLEEIVRRGQRRGELRRNVSPRLAAAAFLTTLGAILSGAVFEPGEASAEQGRNQLLHLLLYGLREPKPRLKWKPPRNPG